MSGARPLLQALEFQGLEFGPSQAWGSIRMIPVLRRDAPGDLRMAKRSYGEGEAAVALSGDPARPSPGQLWYGSYVPHAFVMQWSKDEEPVASFGAQMFRRDGRRIEAGPFSARLLHRMVRREERNRLRLLPLHVAMEGFLAIQFGGPSVAWSDYSKRVPSSGLSPRIDTAVHGSAIHGLDDALRVFEIHDDQVGTLVFVADALASAFVTSHPDDYRALHTTLIQDFYGELIWQYAVLSGDAQEIVPTLDAQEVSSIDDLRQALERMREDCNEFSSLMADEIFRRPLASERCYSMGPFTLQRFRTDLTPGNNNHIGECIVRKDGTIEYLKTFRLSAAQSRRAFLLQELARHDWDLDATAAALSTQRADLMLRIEKAGFGYMLREDVLAWARKQARKKR